MAIPHWIERPLLKSVDTVMGALPRTIPTRDLLSRCRLVAHRGAHDKGATIKENTIAAFENAVACGASGIEFDVRWAKDGTPVVFHDAKCSRVLDSSTRIHDTTSKDLRRLHPEIPTLDEVVARFAGKTHFMIELKRPRLGLERAHLESVARSLAGLEPVAQYHLMSIKKDVLLQTATSQLFPREALLSIAEINVSEMSELTLKENFGGFTGQYLLVGPETIRRHHERGQIVGTGFADSRNLLFREINRGVDWIFTNHAPEMAAIIRSLLAGPP